MGVMPTVAPSGESGRRASIQFAMAAARAASRADRLDTSIHTGCIADVGGEGEGEERGGR